MRKPLSQEKDRGITEQLPSWVKPTQREEKQLNLLPVNIDSSSEKQGKALTNTFPLHFLRFKSRLLSLSQRHRVGGGDYSQDRVLPLCCSFSFPPFLCRCSQWAAVLQERPVLVWVFHGLQFSLRYTHLLRHKVLWSIVWISAPL